jgi:hypothetical protein
MIKKACLYLVLILLIAGFARAETFEDTDISGLWYVYELDVHPTDGAYWLFADVNVAGASDVSGGFTGPDGSSQTITGGSASIADDGALSASFTTNTGLTGTFVDGLQDQNHTIFSYVSADTENALGFGVGLKSGGQYQTADMEGQWRFYGLEVDPVLPGLYWVVGDAQVESSGTVSSGQYSGPDGTTIELTSGQFSIGANGKITAAFSFEGGFSSQLKDGMVDALKTFAVFVDLDSTGRMGFDIALKKGGSYQSGDLAGTWIFYNFTIDSALDAAYWVFGNGTIDNSGSLTGSYTAPDASQFTISSGQAAIDSSGEISGSFTVDGVATETIQSGFMDQNKSIIVFVGTSDNGQMDLGIGLRTSAVPTLVDPAGSDGDSGGGGDGDGGGGCFIGFATQ